MGRLYQVLPKGRGFADVTNFVWATVDLERFSTALRRAVSCDKQFAADGLLLIASTMLILGLSSIGSTCHRMCCKVGCITYRQQVDYVEFEHYSSNR